MWEAVLEPSVAELGEIVWIVDMNRQSLDRVVPNIAAGRLASMFSAARSIKIRKRKSGGFPWRSQTAADR